jgi:hypothetical protein
VDVGGVQRAQDHIAKIPTPTKTTHEGTPQRPCNLLGTPDKMECVCGWVGGGTLNRCWLWGTAAKDWITFTIKRLTSRGHVSRANTLAMHEMEDVDSRGTSMATTAGMLGEKEGGTGPYPSPPYSKLRPWRSCATQAPCKASSTRPKLESVAKMHKDPWSTYSGSMHKGLSSCPRTHQTMCVHV